MGSGGPRRLLVVLGLCRSAPLPCGSLRAMTIRYSRRPDDVAAARAFLITTINRPDDQLPRYGEVAAAIGSISRAVAPVLNSIARECEERGEPDLSAVVVLGGTRLPGSLH